MDEEKLEIIKTLSKYNADEMSQIMIIMTYWDDMIKDKIISIDDIDNLSNLSPEKQDSIKRYVTQKINEHIGRENNEWNKKKKFWHIFVFAYE